MKDKIERCPYCNAKLTEYKDYSGSLWIGCDKCEEFERLLKEVEE